MRKYILEGGSTSLRVDFEGIDLAHFQFALCFCLMIAFEEVTSQLPALVGLPHHYAFPSETVNQNKQKLPLVKVFYHSIKNVAATLGI